MQTPDPPRAELEYERLAEIAVSATARVDLCRITEGPHRGALVAVKRLHDDVADDPEFVKMFHDEVWMTSALNHENVVRVLGWGEGPDGPYFATEFVRGVSLARLMRTVFQTGEMFSERLVVYLASCLCKGMAAAHELRSPAGEFLNLVHRDLTPENVLVSFYGEVKVTDFGLAKAKRRASRTITGLVKGAREYMSPEQIEGLPLDRRVDIFALGVMLFELFCGQKPWVSKSGRDTMRQIVEAPPPDLAKLRPGIHSVLVGVVERCLAKDPSNRFQGALDLDRELMQWLMLHGYHENQDHLARFVRRNAMRQMRWCEKAIAGDFRDGRGPNLAAAPPVTPADEALLASADAPPPSKVTRVDTPSSASGPLQSPWAVAELSDSAIVTDPDGVAMEVTSEEVSTLIQRPEHARAAARAVARARQLAIESTDSIPTLPVGGAGDPPPSAPPIHLAALGASGGSSPVAPVPHAPAVPPAPVAAAPPAAPAGLPPVPAAVAVAAAAPPAASAPQPQRASSQESTPHIPQAVLPQVPQAVLPQVSAAAPTVGHLPAAPPLATRAGNTLRPVSVPRPGGRRTEPPPALATREPLTVRDAPAAREAAAAPPREVAAVQRQAQAIMEDAVRVGGRAETAADRARAAAARALSAADVARKAGQRAERAAAAAELAREAILLVAAGNVTEARERLHRAEQLRESSRSAADEGDA